MTSFQDYKQENQKYRIDGLELQFLAYNNVITFDEQGLWLRLLKLGPTDDPLSSFGYGTILGMPL